MGDSNNLTSFFSFTSSNVPAVKAPLSLSSENERQDWGEPGSREVTTGESSQDVDTTVGGARQRGLEYINQFVEEEQEKIRKINLGEQQSNHQNGNDSQVNRLNTESRGRGGPGRGGGGGRGRGRGRGKRQNDAGDGYRPRPSRQNYAPGNRGPQEEEAVYGSTSSGRSDERDEVFSRYDFSRRKFDTSNLVINNVRGKILDHLAKHQVMTVEGFTGCGKTTQVPQFILDDAATKSAYCRIAVTQPRRIAAISVAQRVADERFWNIGQVVGYQVGMNKCVTDDTRITYMTTGVLLQLLIAKKNLIDWTHIIIDEVHERDLETDLLLLVLKKVMVDTADKNTKIILMSATLDAKKFSSYFPTWATSTSTYSRDNFNVIVDQPNQYEIKEFFLEVAASMTGFENFNMEGIEEPKVHTECYEIATKLIEGFEIEETKKTGKPVNGSVLIFLPGLMEIETLFKILCDVNNYRENTLPNSLKWVILPLHSTITNEEQQKVFHPPKTGYRKIILATNIAESSITVPDIKYVIDFCLTKNLSCDPTTNYTCLRLEWASKNQCLQRRGRCGRVSSGAVYKMVTKKFYETLDQETSPEMLRSSLESVVLQVKLLNMGPPRSVLALAVDPPTETNIGRAVSNLKEIGALTIGSAESYDVYDGELTYVGSVLSRLPIDIKLGRLILLGHAFGCLEEAVIIAAGLSVKSPFAYPYTKRLDAYLQKLTWSQKSFSDCMALLNLYKAWIRRHTERTFQSWGEEKHWARTYFAQVSSLREMKALTDELYKRLKLCGINYKPVPVVEEEQKLLLKVVIAGAFYPNFFTRNRPNKRDYHKDIARDVVGNDPFLSVVFHGFPTDQPGELYKKEVARAVAYQNCVPKIEFHGSKVVVVFDSRGSYIGPISTGVYRAVKMRQLRTVISFNTPSRDEAHALLSSLNEKLDEVKLLKCPGPVKMPSLRTNRVQALLIEGESPSEFYVIRKSDEPQYNDIKMMLYEHRLTLKPLRSDHCQPGQLCIVNNSGEYRRARIDCEPNSSSEVFVYLIDRGPSFWISLRFVFSLSKELLEMGLQKIPALAIQCRLSEIRPSVRTGCTWCDEARHEFQDYCFKNNNQIVIEIFSIVNCVISGVVTNSSNPDTQSINSILKERKFADSFLESQVSRDHQSIRTKIKFDKQIMMDDENGSTQYTNWEDMQNMYSSPERLVPLPKITGDFVNQAVLRGPHNPLEMSFTSLCRSAHLKQVMIEGSSINSVAFDHNHINPSSNLMIASNVSVAARSGNIMARETTIMPPVPGLCGLLAMIFCPKMEFRVDDSYTAYTGCITGLGTDPGGSSSIYPDHDMEIVFDTEIDNEDVSLINSIRATLNVILSNELENDSNSPVGGISLRKDMRNEAIRLLDRERRICEEIWPEDSHQWNKIDKNRVHSNGRTERDNTHVFPLHDFVKLGQRH